MDKKRILITGCSRGLGRQLLKIIVKKNPEFQVIGTVRGNPSEWQERWNKEFPEQKVTFMKLDLSCRKSIDEFVELLIGKKYELDVLVNNAAMGLHDEEKPLTQHLALQLLTTNVLNTIYLTQCILPFLTNSGRIINVSSKLGALRYHSPHIQQKFNHEGLTQKDMAMIGKQYSQRCGKNDLEGFYISAYGTSKMLLNYWSRFILTRQISPTQTTIAMSPGHCSTDMGGEKALRSPLDGAMTIYDHLEGNFSSTLFYHLGKPYDFSDCGPHEK